MEKNQAGLNLTRAYSEFPQWRGEPRRGSECAEAEISDGGDERRRARVDGVKAVFESPNVKNKCMGALALVH